MPKQRSPPSRSCAPSEALGGTALLHRGRARGREAVQGVDGLGGPVGALGLVAENLEVVGEVR